MSVREASTNSGSAMSKRREAMTPEVDLASFIEETGDRRPPILSRR